MLAGTRPGISGGGKSFPGFPRNKIDGAGFAIGFEPARLGGGDEEAGLPLVLLLCDELFIMLE